MTLKLDAYIIDAVRTPRGKGSAKGALHSSRPVDLVATLLQALVARQQIDSATLDDLILGCVTQVGDQGANIAKIAALYAGLSDSLSGMTINRFCCSGLDAIGLASARLAAGLGEAFVAGGVESISRVPMQSDKGAWFSDREVAKKTGFVHMPQAADLLACAEGISRAELDAYAIRSHERAALATEQARFAASLIAVRNAEGTVLLDRDELIRPGMQLSALAQMPALLAEAPASKTIAGRYPDVDVQPRHSVANAPGLADGASAILLASKAGAARRDWRPRARIRAYVTRSVEPVKMLHGNVEAASAALEAAGLKSTDIDVFEVNESFAVVPLHFQRAMKIADDKLNVNGGAIAMGHPLGATGGMLIATALDHLDAVDGHYALASICGGAGVASAMIIERV